MGLRLAGGGCGEVGTVRRRPRQGQRWHLVRGEKGGAAAAAQLQRCMHLGGSEARVAERERRRRQGRLCLCLGQGLGLDLCLRLGRRCSLREGNLLPGG